MRVEVLWGSRTANITVPVPLHLLPNSLFRYKIPSVTPFFRKWNPLLVAGGGGGAGQSSPGQDAQLSEYGGGENERGALQDAVIGGKDGMAGGSSLQNPLYCSHGGAGFYGNAESHDGIPGAKSFCAGGEGGFGGGFGGGGGGRFSGGGGGGYSGGAAGGFTVMKHAFGGGGGGSFADKRALNLSMSTGHHDEGLVHLQLLANWRDGACPIRDRVESLHAETGMDLRLQTEFIRRITSRIALPGSVQYSLEKGWQHTMSVLEEFDARNAEQKEQKMRYDGWNGQTAEERFQGPRFMKRFASMGEHKLQDIGVQNPQIICKQRTFAEKTQEQMLASLKKFDETHAVYVESMKQESDSSEEIARIQARRSQMAGEKQSFTVSNSDHGACVQFANAVALGNVSQVQTLLSHGFSVNSNLGSKGSALHVAGKKYQ
jgi:hypothetical protein